MVETSEILFIRKNAPRGLYRMVADNLGLDRSKVRNELNRLKEEYDPAIVKEARRLLKATKGLEYRKSEV